MCDDRWLVLPRSRSRGMFAFGVRSALEVAPHRIGHTASTPAPAHGGRRSEVPGGSPASLGVVLQLAECDVAVWAEQPTHSALLVVVIDNQQGRALFADGAAPALMNEERVEVVVRQAVLALEGSPSEPASATLVASCSRKDRRTVSLVPTTFLRGPTRFAQRVSPESPLALDRELVESLVNAALAADRGQCIHGGLLWERWSAGEAD